MSILKLFLGKKGVKGANGADGLSSDNIFGFDIKNPLLSLFSGKNKAGVINGALTTNRSTEASFVNRYGNIEYFPAGESTNLVTYSNDFSQWDKTNLSIVSTNNLDPDGGSTATELSCDSDSLKGIQLSTALTSDKYYTLSFWVKSTFGTVDALSLYGDFGFNDIIDVTVSGIYQRVSRTFNPTSNISLIGIQPTALNGAKFIIYGVQVEEGSKATFYKPTAGTTTTQANLDRVLRFNQNGYLFEGAETNLCTNSEDFDSNNWVKSGVTVSAYAAQDPFGQIEKKIQLTSLAASSILLTNTSPQGYVFNNTYTVSLYGYTLNGSVNAVLISLGGGDKVSMNTFSTNGFNQESISVIAGDFNNDLVIEIVSEASNANVAVTAIQAEIGELSTYIKSGSNIGVRGADTATIGSYGNITNNDFTFTCYINNYNVLEGVNYLFNNNQIGALEFSCRIESGQIVIKSALEELFFDWDGGTRLAITYLDKSTSVYEDGLLISTQSFSGDLPILSDDFIIMSDSAFNNSLYGYLGQLEWYNKKMNDDEIKYIHGSAT
tara:strand:+ start:448 stop:2097 length:1650 start_codon:yes stop_codon:yes gene_type:complete